MDSEPEDADRPPAEGVGTTGMPVMADRAGFQAELDALRMREKAQTRGR